MLIATLVFVVSAALAIVAFCVALHPSVWLKIWNPYRRFPGCRSPIEKRGGKLVGIRLRSAMVGLIFLLAAVILPIIIISRRYPTGSGRGDEPMSAGSQAPEKVDIVE